MWPDFYDTISLRFAPIPVSPEPKSNGDKLVLAWFFELVHRWGPIANETMEDYVHHFERDLIGEYPDELPKEEKCLLLWQRVPKYIRDVTCFHENDYYHLRSEVVYADLEGRTQNDKRPRMGDSPPRSTRQRGESSGIVKQEDSEEKDPKEDDPDI